MEGGASTKWVVVATRVSGFLGSSLVMKLRQVGYTVQATLRDLVSLQ
jgi:nucleoside-diphosphate-sugar epimerase